MLIPLLSAGRKWGGVGKRLFWPVLEQFSSPASQVVLAPLLLQRIGAGNYGLWVIAISIQFGAPLLTAGRSLSMLVVVPGLGGAMVPLRGQLSRMFREIVAVIVGLLILGQLIGPWLPHPAGLSSREMMTYLFLIISLLGVVEVDNTFGCALKGCGRFDLAAICEAAGRGIHVLACYLLVVGGASVVDLLWVSFAVFALKALLKFFALRLLISSTKPDIPSDMGASTRFRKELRDLGWWNCLQVVSGIAFYAADRWAVGYLSGAAMLAAYAICNQYTQFAHSISAAAGQVLIPWVSRLNSRDGVQDPRRILRVACFASALSCVPILLAWTFSGPALSAWIGPSFASENATLVDRLSVVFLVLAINVPFVNLLIGLRQSRFVALLTVSAGALLVISGMIWRPSDGLAIANLKIAFGVIAFLAIARLVKTVYRTNNLK